MDWTAHAVTWWVWGFDETVPMCVTHLDAASLS
jgi:hypothetical protein